MLAFSSPVWAIVFGVAAVVLVGIVILMRSRKGRAAGGGRAPARPTMPEAGEEEGEEETVT